MMFSLKNSTVEESWVWAGSLMGVAVTRQAALGVVPLAVIVPLWQRQQIQLMQNQSQQQQARVQRQFQSWQQDCLTSLANNYPQSSQDAQAGLQELKEQLKALRTNLGQTHAQVAQVKDNQGSLFTQVQQLHANLGRTQDQVKDSQRSLHTQVQQLHTNLEHIQNQVKDSQGSLHTQVQQLRANLGDIQNQVKDNQGSLFTQVQLDQMGVDMRLDTSATKHLTAVRQQLSCVLRDLRVLQLSQVQDRGLRQDVDQLRQDLDRVAQALAPQPQRKPIGVFIDGANINHSARQRGVGLDYPALVEQLVGRDPQPDVFFYSGRNPDNLAHAQLKRDLEAAGFTVNMPKVTYRSDGSSKANMDGQMIVDMMLGNYDRVVFLSGDGDFAPVLRALRARGIRVDVAAFSRDTHGSLKTFPFVDLTKLLHPGGQVVDLPQKQVPPQQQA